MPESPIRVPRASTAAAAVANIDAAVRRGIAAIVDETRRDNTDRAYRTKIFEFLEFSDYVRGQLDEAPRYLVSYEIS